MAKKLFRVFGVVLGFSAAVLWAGESYTGWSLEDLKKEVRRLEKENRELRKCCPKAAEENSEQLPEGAKIIDDFEDVFPKAGTSWWAGCDTNGMGTWVKPQPFARKRGGSPRTPRFCAALSGYLGPNEPPWTWAALSLGLSPGDRPVDWTSFRALGFFTRGKNAQQAVVRIERSVVKDYAHFQALFETKEKWEWVVKPFEEFKQPDWGKPQTGGFPDVVRLSFSPYLHEAAFEFEVDDITLLP